MTLKRTYQVPSRYTNPKRLKTLDNEVTRLKKQVNANKKELKYYDGYFDLTQQATEISFLSDVLNSSGAANNPTFVGRKIHIRKMEIRVQSSNTIAEVLFWREKRPGKTVTDGKYPLALDPEYHTPLRNYEFKQDTDCQVKQFTIDFGTAGRLVEFDEQNTAIAQGAIVSGDIKCYINVLEAVQFRVWYTDS